MGMIARARDFITGKPSALTSTGGRQRRDSARFDLQEFGGWYPGNGFEGSDLYGENDAIRGRARDLDQNNAWINGGLDRRVESVIGGQIRLSAQPVEALLNRDYNWRMQWTADVQMRHRIWANDINHRCDAAMRLSHGAQTKLAYLGYVRDGEAMAEIRDDARGIPNTTNVMLINPDRLSTPQNTGQVEGPNLRSGIALANSGAPIGYWIRSGHPNDPTPGTENQFRWSYIPRYGPSGRTRFIHVFNPRREDQNRGISRLSELMVPAKMLDRVDRAEVQASLKSAIYSFFIKSPGTTDELAQALAPDGSEQDAWINQYLSFRKDNPIRVPDAGIVHLAPDEDVVVPNAAHPNSNYPTFAKFVLQKIASSLGISYPQLSQDWAGINYSSARALLNELWRSFLEDRHFFTQQWNTQIYAAWLEIEVAIGAVKMPGGPANFYRNKTAICMAEWIGPGRGSVDPLKEANSDNLDTAAGRKSTVEAILERGRDPSDVLAEEKWYLEERKAMGLDDPNHNVKAATDAAAADAAGNGGTQEDHDGDGKPNEADQKKPTKPQGAGQ